MITCLQWQNHCSQGSTINRSICRNSAKQRNVTIIHVAACNYCTIQPVCAVVTRSIGHWDVLCGMRLKLIIIVWRSIIAVLHCYLLQMWIQFPTRGPLQYICLCTTSTSMVAKTRWVLKFSIHKQCPLLFAIVIDLIPSCCYVPSKTHIHT